jgi:hypothetical protein
LSDQEPDIIAKSSPELFSPAFSCRFQFILNAEGRLLHGFAFHSPPVNQQQTKVKRCFTVVENISTKSIDERYTFVLRWLTI